MAKGPDHVMQEEAARIVFHPQEIKGKGGILLLA